MGEDGLQSGRAGSSFETSRGSTGEARGRSARGGQDEHQRQRRLIPDGALPSRAAPRGTVPEDTKTCGVSR